MRIQNLATHPVRYVTVAELAEYWAVSRQHIYKSIESGMLATIRFGVRCHRIPIDSARECERNARMTRAVNASPPSGRISGTELPRKIGVQRVKRAVGET